MRAPPTDLDRRTDLLRIDKQVRTVRWLLVPLAVAQALLVDPALPLDTGGMAVALASCLVALNLASHATRLIRSPRVLVWTGRTQLGADTLLAVGIVLAFEEPAAWAVLVLPVTEAALRGGVRLSFAAWAVCAGGLGLRSILGSTSSPVDAAYPLAALLAVAAATGYLAQVLASRMTDHSQARGESERRAELMRVVAKASRSMSTLDPAEVLAAAADAAQEMGFEAVFVATLKTEGFFVDAAFRGLAADFASTENDARLLDLARSLGRTVVVDERSDWALGLKELRPLDLRAVAATPIRQSGEVAAVLVAGKRSRAAISRFEIEALDLVASHSGVALTTAHHFTERQLLEAQLKHEAFHDSLTGLPNRTLFFDRLDHCLERKAAEPSPTAVLFVDLDGFKKVNDSFGHDAGDEVLRMVTARLESRFGPGDTVARYGGDEFSILIESPESELAVAELAGQIVEDMGRPFPVRGREVYIAASIGVSYHYDQAGQARDFLREADLAMYRAKERGGARSELYSPTMSTQARQGMEMELALRRAIDEGQLVVHYQPAVAAPSQEPIGLEALVRWNHPVRGLVPAGRFISLAEESGLIVPLSRWVFESVAAQVAEWRRDPALPRIPVWVNVSAAEFTEPDFVRRVASVIERHGLDADDIILEVTESVVMREDPATMRQIRKLDDMGIRLAIDDFGLGYSSLAYLKRFRFSVLKIDKSFVAEVATRPTDQAIVRYVLGLAEALELPVVAEGVETQEQMDYLVDLGCGYVQGFHICRPVEAVRAEAFMRDRALATVPAAAQSAARNGPAPD